MQTTLAQLAAESAKTIAALSRHEPVFAQIVQAILTTIKSGGKVLTCGNGGSAADAMHLAEELVGRYRRERPSWPAVCLNADPSLLTCIGNDYGFDAIFSRQVEGLGGRNDLLICFTTSGNSGNILRALETAKARGVKTVALLGKGGGKAKGKADLELIVESNDTARIQEAHTFLLHALLESVECEMLGVK